jgi:hypothetical protein
MRERGMVSTMQTPKLRYTGAVLLAFVLALPASALASHQPSHVGAPGGTAAITENNDSDGVPNNIPDEGDNQHPSGKDRSVENGGSGDQGRSSSTPDQNGRGPERDTGGTDKPNGPGGADIIDQDRNNGCGNDDDFDDDNEGLCGKVKNASAFPENGKPSDKAERDENPKPQEQEKGNLGGEDQTPPLGVAAGQAGGSQPGAGAGAAVVTPVVGQPGAPPSGQVLGEVIVQGMSGGNVLPVRQGRNASAGALATTGAGFAAVVLLAVGLIAAGTVFAHSGRGKGRSAQR